MAQFAKCMSRVSGEAVREILALMSDPSVLSFGGGSPARETFPVDAVREIVTRALAENPVPLLQYGLTEGWPALREAYLEHIVRAKGVRAETRNVMTLTGSTQGIDLVSEIFLDPGDCVLVESPTFLGALNVFRRYDARLVPVEMDDGGVVTEDLEEKMKKHRPKMLYTIPTFQNPTGRTIPAERRRRIAQLAGAHDVIVLEDDPYCDLRYRGAPTPPIKSFDESGHVVLLNSFSKIISPGIRVGAMTADAAIIEKAGDAKQLADTHTTNLEQSVCAEFLNRGLLPGHLREIVPVYEARLAAMLDGIAAHFPAACEYTRPEGGLFVWVKLPGGADAGELVKRAVAGLKIAFVPGNPFFVEPRDGKSCIRLNFSSNAPERIAEGMERLGDFFKKEIK